MSLNEQSTNVPYALGRLFAVLETVQERALPNINATIKDKYFNAVAATPASVLPLLIKLTQKHLQTLDKGQMIYYDKLIGQIMNVLPETLPTRMTLQEQGAFCLGYYHQKQKQFEKKEEK